MVKVECKNLEVFTQWENRSEGFETTAGLTGDLLGE